MRAIGYVRVSTEEQGTKGVSLGGQRARIEAYCKLYDLELVGIEEDAGVSACTLEREGLQSALGRLREGEAEALVVAKLDRLTRKVSDLCALCEEYFAKKFQLLSVSEQIDTRTAAGRLVLNILATVAQWERETIGERTAAAMAHKRSRGEYTGGHVPFGMRLEDGRLVKDAGERRLVALARALRARGVSLRVIGAELGRRGLRSRRGGELGAASVKFLLEAAEYAV